MGPILSIEIAQNKAYTALFGVPTQDFFKLIKVTRRFGRHPHAFACGRLTGEGFPLSGRRNCRGDRVSGAPTVQNDVDCADSSPSVRIRCGAWWTESVTRRVVASSTGEVPTAFAGMAKNAEAFIMVSD